MAVAFSSVWVPLFISNLLLFKAEMKRFTSTDTSVLKHHYEKKLLDLEHEKKALQVIALLIILIL